MVQLDARNKVLADAVDAPKVAVLGVTKRTDVHPIDADSRENCGHREEGHDDVGKLELPRGHRCPGIRCGPSQDAR